MSDDIKTFPASVVTAHRGENLDTGERLLILRFPQREVPFTKNEAREFIAILSTWSDRMFK